MPHISVRVNTHWLSRAVLLATALLTAFAYSHAQTVTTLHSFTGLDGANPETEVLEEGPDGNLYGTTNLGGVAADMEGGTVFQISLKGTLQVIHYFQRSDGRNPIAGLILGRDGLLYGTTTSRVPYSPSGGTIFRISTDGSLTVLADLGKRLADPVSPLLQADDGDFYGTTTGAHGFATSGTVFRLTPSGQLTLLHQFTGGTDGTHPHSGVIEGADGAFYGTCSRGGQSDQGTVYRVTSDGVFSTLHSFSGPDGASPSGGLTLGTDGNFYGTTEAGGRYKVGTVFLMTPSGSITSLHNFNITDGAAPYATLFQASDGKLYGTTDSGGIQNMGTIFAISSDGTFYHLYSFDGIHGTGPEGGLMQGANGLLYGTTTFGGNFNLGTVYSLDVGLALAGWPR
jgi:uncharacterized repeat protein (TIGR03803 family)